MTTTKGLSRDTDASMRRDLACTHAPVSIRGASSVRLCRGRRANVGISGNPALYVTIKIKRKLHLNTTEQIDQALHYLFLPQYVMSVHAL